MSPVFDLLRALCTFIPTQCAVCGALQAQRLCTSCSARHAPIMDPASASVSTLASALRPSPLNGLPPPPDWAFAHWAAALPYQPPWDALIHRFKSQAALDLAAPFAEHLWHASSRLPPADWVLAMPLSSARLKQRSFNQSQELVRHLLRRLQKNAQAPPRSHDRLLLKCRETRVQHHLPRAERLQNVQQAFQVLPRCASLIKGQHLWLVDDVMTTGATLHAASQVLLEAGAAQVSALVLAYTSPPSPTIA